MERTGVQEDLPEPLSLHTLDQQRGSLFPGPTLSSVQSLLVSPRRGSLRGPLHIPLSEPDWTEQVQPVRTGARPAGFCRDPLTLIINRAIHSIFPY